MNEDNVVGIAKVLQLENKLEIKELLFNLLDHMKNLNKVDIPLNANIMIKPNICLVKGYEIGATVDPFIVKCLIDWILQNYYIQTITIGEADATELNVDIAFKVLGWRDMFSKYPNVNILNLSKDDHIEVGINGLYIEKIKMSKTYMESDFLISVGKLKTHGMTGITCNLKNMFGANPIKYKAQYHSHLDEVICDLAKAKLPNLCLIDGIIAMEGLGPVSGKPKPMGILILGNDIVATDHVCARVMGFKPNSISHLKLAEKMKLGSTHYETFGEKIEDTVTKFEFIPIWKRIVLATYQNKFLRRNSFWKKLLIKIFGA